MAVDFGLLTDLDQIDKLFTKLADIPDGFGFDIETGYDGPPREKFSIHPETAFVVGVSYSGHPSWARYTPLRHDTGGNIGDDVAFAHLLARLLGSGKGIGHNLSFELRHLAKFFRERLTADELKSYGLASNGYFPLFSDSMVEGYNLGQFREHGLKAMTLEVFGHRMTEFTDLFPDATSKQQKSQRFNILELSSRVVSYACEDAAYSLSLSHKHRPLVAEKLMYKVDMALIPYVCRMEDRGLAVDWASMARYDNRAQQFNDALRAEIMNDLTKMCGEPIDINLGSSPQVSNVLYQKLGLRTTKLTNSGAMSTDAKALAGLAKKHPIVQRILDWRELRKLSGSYLTKYPRDFNYAEDGRAHPSHNLCFVISGRFSVQDPAYQQLPKKYHYELSSGTTFDLKFRDFIMAGPNHYLIGFDYSQVELRVLAGFCKEPALVKAFAEGIDVHQMTAAQMFGIPVETVTEDQRSVGKTINFATVYGQGPKGMAEKMGISIEEAKAFLEKYFATYSSLKSYLDRQTREGVARGKTVSKFGRVHPIWALDSDKPAIRANGERLCVNAPIQGCLPSDTCVLTRAGWTPMGEFVDGSEVWTGAEWATAVRLPKGVAPRVRLHLSDGRTFDCDDRHKLLVSEGAWPEWCLVTDIKGKRLVRDMGQDWGCEDRPVEDWYWLGRMVGDGSFSYEPKAKTGYHRQNWTCSFNGTDETASAHSFMKWLDRGGVGGGPRFAGGTNSIRGYTVSHKEVRGKGCIKVSGATAASREFWLSMGLEPGVRASGKRIPGVVFTLNRERRQAFFDGLYGADGSTRDAKIISASHELLKDSLRLAQTLGFEGRISKEYTHKVTGTSWRELWFYESGAKHLTVERLEYLDPEEMYTLSVNHSRHAFSSEGLISKNSAADIMRVAMVRCMRAIDNAGYDDRIHLIMNIHDALIFEVDTAVHPQQVIDLVQPQVVFPIEGWPPIKADWEVGVRWGSMSKLKLDTNNKIILPEPVAS